MKIIKPSVTFRWITPDALKQIESAARVCYKTEDKICDNSDIEMAKKLLKRQHYAMFDHASMSYHVVCDRGVTHEFVRHRLFGFAQESTRYCDYNKTGEILCVVPTEIQDSPQDKIVGDNYTISPYSTWYHAMETCEEAYNLLRKEFSMQPQIARAVLPTCLKTELIVTGDFTEWRHFFKLRTALDAHPQMREIACMILKDAVTRVAIVFDEYYNNFNK